MNLKQPRLNLARAISLAMLMFTLGAASCASRQETHFRRMSDARYSAREQPAEARSEPVRDLAREGYLLIGYVEVRQTLRVCEGTACWDYAHEQPPSEVARQLASERGGDVVLFEKQNEPERRVEERLGRCKEVRSPSLLGPMRPRYTGECLEYEVLPYVQDTLIALGFVWRHEPEFAESHNARLREELFGPKDAADTR